MKPRQIGLVNSVQNHHIIPNGPVPNYSSIRLMVPDIIPSFTLSLGQPQILSRPVINPKRIILGDGLYNNPSRVTLSIIKDFQVQFLPF